ncbi:MAG TPA: GTPase HflX [Candidatus Hydrothermia bacterium]|nr:GTPase HflX [Candidatus Hydrothermae bacterium]MDD3648586.1 GTPase HflX [Candidatus Hydrothermia bacterium]MDD5572671.1 GTPase HflX [Candidatus Hydrothermia bacterium]HOK22554.1 GTPase HflX [Candidatus Hydrothermia bacterium]HOL23261.1 GTPase HflX [Candidatus Hydrothermia bacterium]
MYFISEKKTEKALLVGVCSSSQERWHELNRLEELQQLAEAAGAEVFEKIIQIRPSFDPSYLIGKGKAIEIKDICEKFDIDVLIFDQDLSPSQVRNLEKIIKCKIIDRTELILDIFAQHADTVEAKIQVELAQLLYRMTRLTGKGIDLSRLGGGIGTRGPGEKKLEVDRRKIKERISHLKKELGEIEKTRELHYRRRREIYKVTLIGYTNSGKSSVMNLLTRSTLPVEERPFSTLDATTRIMYQETLKKPVVISDTVGFIEDIPHHLIASFKATLGVAREANLLVHVIDIINNPIEDKINTVQQVLNEIQCGDKPILNVFNKIDLVIEPSVFERIKERYPDALFISAKLNKGIESLKQEIIRTFQSLELNNTVL